MPRAEGQRIGVLSMAEKPRKANGQTASSGQDQGNRQGAPRQPQLRRGSDPPGITAKRH